MTSKIKGGAGNLKRHPPAKAKAAEAQAAVATTDNDRKASAKAAQTETMDKAKPGKFDEAAFIAAVNKAIADASPKTLEEADDFAESGKAGAVKDQVMGKVTKGKEDSAKDVKEKTDQPPDASKVKPKPVTPMPAEKPGPRPPDPGASGGMPAPAPIEQTNLDAGKCETEGAMAEAGVTEEHLKNANEPQFQEALDAKREGEEHSAKAPDQVRDKEAKLLEGARTEATASTTGAIGDMHLKKGSIASHIAGDKASTKSKDEAKRAEVTGHIEGIYAETKGAVDGILRGLDTKVTDAFTQGEAEARKAFETNHRTEMARWKKRRYKGLRGGYRWFRDKVKGLPSEANDIYVRARDLYLDRMGQTIARIAHLVGTELTRAKDRIQSGKDKIEQYVSTLDPALKKFGKEAQQEIGSKFEDLEGTVDKKQDDLVADLAQRFVEARGAVDDEITKMQEENQGLWDKAKNAVKGVIQLVSTLKDMFVSVMSKAASALPDILAHPIAFIENLFGAMGEAFSNFAANFVEKWLPNGLRDWLFGTLASAGIEMPESLDSKGILKVVGSLIGLSWSNIKGRIGQLAPWAGKSIDFLKEKVGVIATLASGEIGALWDLITSKVPDLDLEAMVLPRIKEYIGERIVRAGIGWVLGLLNPAAALIKIVQGLVAVVQWLVENGAELAHFIGSLMDSVVAVAKGAVAGVAGKIEDALGASVRLVIGFLASLLNLGGIPEKIKSILLAVQKPIRKAIDFVVKGALKVAKPLLAGARRLTKGAKGLVAGIKGRFGKKDKGRDEKAKDLDLPLPSLNLNKPVTMKGHSHSLLVHFRGPRIAVELASNPVLLLSRIDVALGNGGVKANAEAVAALKDARSKLESHEGKWNDAKATSSKEVQDKAILDIQSETDQIANLLAAVGHVFDITALKESQYVLGGEIRQAYRGGAPEPEEEGGAFRTTFYGGFNSAANVTHRRKELNRLMALKVAAVWGLDPLFKSGTSYVCPGSDYASPHLADPKKGRKWGLTLDHHPISVSKHWNTVGHTSDQKKRTDFYSERSNLQGMCRSCNSSKGGEPLIFKVVDSFKGPGER